jgi:hypothetical protein
MASMLDGQGNDDTAMARTPVHDSKSLSNGSDDGSIRSVRSSSLDATGFDTAG